MAFHAGGQVCQHLGDAAVLPICCNTVHAVRRFRLGFQLVFQGVQFVQRLFVVGGSIGQLRHLYGVLQQLGRHMVLVARVQKHPVQLGQVRRDHPPHIVLVSCVPCTSGNIPASRHRCLHGVARVGPRRALPFQPLPVGLAGCPDDSLRLCKPLVPRLPLLFIQCVHHPPLDPGAVRVQVLVDPLPQHTCNARVCNTFCHRRSDDQHRQICPRFFIAFAVAVLIGRLDSLPHLSNSVQLFHGVGQLCRKQTWIVPGQLLIYLVDSPCHILFVCVQSNPKARHLPLCSGIAAISIDQLIVLRSAPLYLHGKIVQVFVLVPQAAVHVAAFLHNLISNALCGSHHSVPVRLAAGCIIQQTHQLLPDHLHICPAVLTAHNPPGNPVNRFFRNSMGFFLLIGCLQRFQQAGPVHVLPCRRPLAALHLSFIYRQMVALCRIVNTSFRRIRL